MGRNKDQKVNRKNAAGRARNRALAQQANDPGTTENETTPDDGLHKECPKCIAAAGEACKTPSGKPAAKTHAARLK